jgi:trk system potassium uptake protein TrkA
VKKRTIAVLGLSVFGRETALGLASYPEIDVVALDYRREEVDGIAPHVRRAIVADVRQTEILEQEGAKSWSAAVIGIRRHFDSTVLVTHFLKKKIGIRTVIVQVNNLQEEEAIRVLGADLTVFPERDSARHLVATFIHPLLTEIVDLGEDIELMEIEVPKPFVGKNLRSLQLRAQHQLHVVALRAGHREPGAPPVPVEVPPNPDRALRAGERMLLIGPPKSLQQFLSGLPQQ